MAWIELVRPGEATGRLAKIYDQAVKRAGKVFQILQVQSQNPGILDASIRHYSSSMFGPSPISRAQREALATVTSWANDCHY